MIKEEVKILQDFQKHILEKNKLILDYQNGKIALVFLTDCIFRVVMGEEEVDFRTTPAVVDHNLEYIELELQESTDRLLIQTAALEISLNKEVFSLEIYDKKGQLIHRDCRKKALSWQGEEVGIRKEIRANERFYGLGEKAGFLDKRGKKYTMWNTDNTEPHFEGVDPLYQSIPFVIGLAGGLAYGLYFDNSYRTHFDLGFTDENYYSIKAEGGKLDYYFIYGPGLKEVVTGYTSLTGRQPLPPRWALGYHQSRYSYYPEEEVRELARKFREKEIPCDVIHLDIHYMDGYRVFTWDEKRFPHPEKMIKDLSNKGFKTVCIIDPGVKIDSDYPVYQEGIEKDYFLKYQNGELYHDSVWPGECLFPDFTRKEVREWWGSLHQGLLEQGVKGIWNDMNEPAVFGNDRHTMDDDRVIHDNDGDPGPHGRFHNLYALYEAMATYQGLQKYTGERPFILTRAGFAGIQRYAAVWTGDNRSLWEHLQQAMPMLLNLGLSGVNFVGTDVGGFNGHATGELLTRWTQFGVFTPFFRNHTMVGSRAQEPWAFGSRYEKIIKEYIELRYRFIYHLYNLFYRASKSGIPALRPLVMEYPDDSNTYNLFDQLLVGDSILIAPVYQPDRDQRLVYLPEGEWLNFWNGERYQGKRYYLIDAPLETMPIFIKAGTIIPLVPVMNYTDEKDIGELKLEVYQGSAQGGKYLLYEDDGISYRYQDGEYNLKEFSFTDDGDKTVFTITTIKDGYQPGYRNYLLEFKYRKEPPRSVIIDGKEFQDWKLSDDKQNLLIKVPKEAREVVVLY